MKESNLNHTDQGKGPVIVFIHGFCESKILWKNFVEKFSKSYRVIAPDLPGFGESNLFAAPENIELYAEEVYKLLTTLKLTRCIMIGHSLGGYVTLAFAERHPQMLSGFGMFHSTAFADSEEKKASRNKTIDFVSKHGSEAFASSFVAPLFYIKNRERNEPDIKVMVEIVSRTKKESIIAATKAMRDRLDRTEVLKNIKVPVLFIVGKEDSAVPLEKSLEQCHLPADGHVSFLADCGHMGMYEKEKETLKIVQEFLQYCSM